MFVWPACKHSTFVFDLKDGGGELFHAHILSVDCQVKAPYPRVM